MQAPFASNQPIERYRLLHQMPVAGFLGIPEALYFRLVAGDQDVPDATLQQIARRLKVPRWLINECAPRPRAEATRRLGAILEEGRRYGYYRVDEETGEALGPVFLDEPFDEIPPLPADQAQLAEALVRLVRIHGDGANPDFDALHAYICERIRGVLGLGPGEPFDAEAWARSTSSCL